jgi:tRNA 2-thiocytidine biosynthesis protein TtcA
MELVKYSEQLGFPNELSLCPHEDKTNRERVRELIKGMEKLNRGARENVFRSMANICHDYIVSNPNKNEAEQNE